MASTPLFCTNCGAANTRQSAFCYACGTPLQSTNNTAEQLVNGLLLKDRYHITGQLGKGGMGAVYKAEDTLFNARPVAIKEMSQNNLTTQQRLEAANDFKREAHMLADLQHSGLPTIYDYFSEAGQWYLVMDFIAGETLEDYLAHSPEGRLPVTEALAIGLQLCDVLTYLHARQPPIIFRDLKPTNVMRTANGHIFLIDFGIARHFKPGQLRDTVAFGSAGYAAPEQYGKTQTTPRSDIYSLGVILHQSLSGNDPANNTPTPFDFPPLDLHGQHAPVQLKTLLGQMLAMNPNNRPETMSEVKQALFNISQQLQATGSTSYLQTAATAAPALVITRPPKITIPLPALVSEQPQTAWKVTKPKPVASPLPIKRTKTYTTYTGHTSIVQTLAWSPNGALIASGDERGQVHIWSAHTYKTTAIYRAHQQPLRALAWSPQSMYIATGDAGGELTVWRAANQKQLYLYHSYMVRITGIAWSPDGKSIAVGDSHGRIRIEEAQSGSIHYSLQKQQNSIQAIAWSPDGTYLAAGQQNGTIHIWNTKTQEIAYSYNKHEAAITAVSWSPESNYLASSDSYGKVHIWKIEENEPEFIYSKHFGKALAAWSPNDQRIASGGEDRTVHLWNAHDGSDQFVYREHQDTITALAWSPDAQRLVSASADKTIKLWQTL